MHFILLKTAQDFFGGWNVVTLHTVLALRTEEGYINMWWVISTLLKLVEGFLL